MTPDLFAPAVVIDTSILRGTGSASAPFQVLRGLASAGLIRIQIPELVLHEFRTHWRDTNLANISASLKALQALTDGPVLSEQISLHSIALIKSLSDIDVESISNTYAENYLLDNTFSVLPLTFIQSRNAWDNYFKGHLPSKKTKNRADIPDAHILAAVDELSKSEEIILFVSSDKEQREIASSIEGTICFDGIDSLIKSDNLQPLLAKWEFDQQWKIAQQTLPFDEVEEMVREFVEAKGGSILTWKEITDNQIPEDNNSAYISMHGEPDEIEIGSPEDWGGGILRYNVTYFTECLLTFTVFRADAFDLPEWVSVEFGDFEKDHYFDAEGYAQVIVNVDVMVRINVKSDSQDISDRVEEISFEEGSLDLSLSEFS